MTRRVEYSAYWPSHLWQARGAAHATQNPRSPEVTWLLAQGYPAQIAPAVQDPVMHYHRVDYVFDSIPDEVVTYLALRWPRTWCQVDIDPE
jgi:hypothetical protein